MSFVLSAQRLLCFFFRYQSEARHARTRLNWIEQEPILNINPEKWSYFDGVIKHSPALPKNKGSIAKNSTCPQENTSSYLPTKTKSVLF